MRLGTTLIVALLLTCGLSQADPYGCECEPGLLHLCRCKVLIDTRVAQQQMNFVARVLNREMPEIFPYRQVEVEAIHPDKLKSLGGEPLQGLYDYGKIWVSSGLVREKALAVIAHEYGHVWHFEHHPDPDAITPLIAEGFAEWSAYKALALAGQADLCHEMLQSPDPLYGKGLRWMLEIEKEHGMQAVLNIARTWNNEKGETSVKTP